jgi:hypothetical protein
MIEISEDTSGVQAVFKHTLIGMFFYKPKKCTQNIGCLILTKPDWELPASSGLSQKRNRRAEQFRAVFVYSTQYHHILELGWPDNHNLPSYAMSHVPMKSICSKGARCPAAVAPGSQSIQHHVHSLAVACEPARSLADDSWEYGWSGWSCD